MRIAHRDSCSNLEELLRKVDTVSIHHKNLQLLAAENVKTHKNLNPSFMDQIFGER